MKKIIRKTKKQIQKMERGQVLAIVAFAIVGLVAIVGLAMDVGVIFIENARLRRAVDSAALAASLQYRKGYHPVDLTRSANEFLLLNGVDIADEENPVIVDTCDTDASLCSTSAMPRKLVRVRASAIAHLAFLPVIGITTAPISAEAVSEAATVDVVLVIDTSESMTFDAKNLEGGEVGVYPSAPPPMFLDPSVCNDDTKTVDAVNDDTSLPAATKLSLITDVEADTMPGECHPFEEVKKASLDFVNQLFFPYDRVSIVTFDKNPNVVLHLTNDYDAIVDAIKNLTVYDAGTSICDPNDNKIGDNPCRRYNNTTGAFIGLDCPEYWTSGDPSQCTTTNIGGGLRFAGLEFANPPMRQAALWVTILLTDGAANSGVDEEGARVCPNTTWVLPFCREADVSASTRHSSASPLYDADDYAHDMADFVGDGHQNALIFTIGLGSQVQNSAQGDPLAGEKLLQYGAADNIGNGLYAFAPSGAGLREIFRQIAENIATRLTH